MDIQNFSPELRQEAWKELVSQLEGYYTHTEKWPVNPILDKSQLTEYIEQYDFENPISFQMAIDHVLQGFKKFHVHTPHPMYLGLFNPRANFPSILGDTITATINPQMAAWSHAPFANELEKFLIQKLGKKFGCHEKADGVFTAGGTEANLTAVCTALMNHFPNLKESGLRSLEAQPVIYTSEESHHSVLKAAVVTGLGKAAVRNIPVDEKLSMCIPFLKDKIEEDLAKGNAPFLVIGTAGTTGGGGFDDLLSIREICNKYKLWMHTDAAYGGACALTEKYMTLLSGIQTADSITFDAHKWLSVPMGAGIYLTRHQKVLQNAFQMTAQYMPKEAEGMDIVDPYNYSLQWSRRFIGLKLYFALLMIGWEGYEKSIEEDFRIGNLLREKLEKKGWKMYNNSPLPILCFNRPDKLDDPDWTRKFVNKLVESRKIWLSTYPIDGKLCIRICITNYLTREKEVDRIANLLDEYQKKID